MAAAAPRLPLDEWAERFRIVAGAGPRTGPWNPAYAPFSLEPMRAFSRDGVSQVTVVSPSQLLKTELIINAVLYTVYYGDDALLWEPDESAVEKIMADRVRPSLMALGPLHAGIDDGRKKRNARHELRLGGGGSVTGVSPQMKTGTGMHTARVAVVDEVDRMGRTDMEVIAEERTTTYGVDAKRLFASTPTRDLEGLSWRLWKEGSAAVWLGRCPHCDELVSMDWDRVRFESDDEGLWLPETAVLACESCGTVWSEGDRLAAARGGCYVHERPESDHQSFRVPGPAHLWRSVRQIARAGAKAWRAARIEHEWDAYIGWRNGMAALPWDDDFRGLSARGLGETVWIPGPRGEEDLGELDPLATVVTAGIDVGSRHIKCEWIAWGIDPESDRVRSWALRYLVLGDEPDDSIDDPELWERLEDEIRRSVWRRPGGGRVHASRILIDCGHRPELIRKWCTDRYAASRPRRLEYFGAQVGPVRGHNAERDNYPVNLEIGVRRNGRRPVQVPAIVYAMTQQLKEQIYDWMEADRRLPEGAERAHRYPSPPQNHGYDARYFREFAGEKKTPVRTPQGKPVTRWERKDGWTRSDSWDCRVYALAALYVQAYPGQLSDYLARKARQRRTAAVRRTVAEVIELHGRGGRDGDE